TGATSFLSRRWRFSHCFLVRWSRGTRFQVKYAGISSLRFFATMLLYIWTLAKPDGHEGASGLKRQVLTSAVFLTGRPHESDCTAFPAGRHLRRHLGPDPDRPPTSPRRTPRRPPRRGSPTQDARPTRWPRTVWRRFQQPRRFLPHQPLGSRRRSPPAG